MKNCVSKCALAKEKGLVSYLHGFDDEHVYAVVNGKEYAHPRSLGGKGRTLPEEYWDKLDELGVRLAKKYIKKTKQT